MHVYTPYSCKGKGIGYLPPPWAEWGLSGQDARCQVWIWPVKLDDHFSALGITVLCPWIIWFFAWLLHVHTLCSRWYLLGPYSTVWVILHFQCFVYYVVAISKSCERFPSKAPSKETRAHVVGVLFIGSGRPWSLALSTQIYISVPSAIVYLSQTINMLTTATMYTGINKNIPYNLLHPIN